MPTTIRKTKSLLTMSVIWAPTNIGWALQMTKNLMRTQPPGLTMMIHDTHGNAMSEIAASTAFVRATITKVAAEQRVPLTCLYKIS